MRLYFPFSLYRGRRDVGGERERHWCETRGLAASHVHPGPWMGFRPATQVCVPDPKPDPPPSSAQADDVLTAEPRQLGLKMSSVQRKQPCSWTSPNLIIFKKNPREMRKLALTTCFFNWHWDSSLSVWDTKMTFLKWSFCTWTRLMCHRF